jgi:hypothetical protein
MASRWRNEPIDRLATYNNSDLVSIADVTFRTFLYYGLWFEGRKKHKTDLLNFLVSMFYIIFRKVFEIVRETPFILKCLPAPLSGVVPPPPPWAVVEHMNALSSLISKSRGDMHKLVLPRPLKHTPSNLKYFCDSLLTAWKTKVSRLEMEKHLGMKMRFKLIKRETYNQQQLD